MPVIDEPRKTDTNSPEAITPALTAYYDNRPLMVRNLVLILLLNLGWSVSFTVISPLMVWRLNSMGVAEGGLGTIGAVNSWVYCFAVMFFAWKSDHTVSRFGRRIPYLFISAPVIILVTILFPVVHFQWALVILYMLQALFMDIKAATIPLLNIDCMPRRMLARTAAPAGIVMGLLGFAALRYGMRLSDWSEVLPYFLAAGILTTTTLIGGFFIKEPPIQDPTTEKFRPWSAMKVALKDRRAFVLMISVSLFTSFNLSFGGWIVLYAKNILNLSRAETGEIMAWGIIVSIVMAFPCAWLVDRVSPYKLLPCYCGLAGLTLWFALHIKTPTDMIITVCCAALHACFYSAADIMVYRNAHPAEVGSVTSTNSCFRGLYVGCVSLFLGFLIEKTGRHYDYAFIFGFIMVTLGLVPLFIYRHLMRTKPEAKALDEATLSH